GDVDERDLFSGKEQGQGAGKPPDVAFLTVSQEIPGGNKDDESPGDDVNVVADIAGVVGDVGRDEKEDAGRERAKAAQPGAQEVRKYDEQDAEQGNRQTGSEVVSSQQPVGQRSGVEEERAVHQRRMAVALPAIVLEGVLCVQTLVVAHDALAQ